MTSSAASIQASTPSPTLSPRASPPATAVGDFLVNGEKPPLNAYF